LINCSVPAHVLVPAGSLLGDRSRQVHLEIGPEVRASPILKAPQAVRSLAPETQPMHPKPDPLKPQQANSPTVQRQPEAPSRPQDEQEEPISTYVYPQNSPDLSSNGVDAAEDAEPIAPPFVHGQAYVVNLLSTLLPNRANSTSSGPNP
ncbi:MAG: hypothetical protein WCD18_24105, partial [Thermosynechococcaceae cyanobacterium]